MGKFFDVMQEAFVGCLLIVIALTAMLTLVCPAVSSFCYVVGLELNAGQEIVASFGTIGFIWASWYIGHKVHEAM